MKKLGLIVLTLALTLLSWAFLVVCMTMPPAPPEWSYEAAEEGVFASLLMSAVFLSTWIATFFSWRKLLNR